MEEVKAPAQELKEKIAYVNNMALVLDIFMKCQFPGAIAPTAAKTMLWVEKVIETATAEARLHPDAHLIAGLLPKEPEAATLDKTTT